ncbi:unnamed protein product [Periconia digitata]|uniref:Uncharacterized protein n=1 Tax=Periconia digitata TaxID=1303443 RepID=A0A9W4ULE6_9PLEO|nr:unnamed protein product [Periconia digitata]
MLLMIKGLDILKIPAQQLELPRIYIHLFITRGEPYFSHPPRPSSPLTSQTKESPISAFTKPKKMYHLTLLALSALSAIASSAPVEVLGSKHVNYLATCYPDDCPIGLCYIGDFKILAAGYFANGPPKSATASPTSTGTLSTFLGNTAWEGDTKSVRVGTVGTLSTNIQKGANSLKQSEFAGDAKLSGGEEFVCFRDGTTKFKITYDLDRYTCTGEYYCPSTDIGV